MADNKKEPLDKCCGTCPFLAKNADKPNPNGWVSGDNKYDWYTQKNLDRLWKDGLSQGDPMVCHSHDDDAADYGGTSAKEGTKKVCFGAILQQYKHVKLYEECYNAGVVTPAKAFQQYKTLVGKAAMSRRGILQAIWMFAIKRTDLFGGLPIATGISEFRRQRNISGNKLDINMMSPVIKLDEE